MQIFIQPYAPASTVNSIARHKLHLRLRCEVAATCMELQLQPACVFAYICATHWCKYVFLRSSASVWLFLCLRVGCGNAYLQVNWPFFYLLALSSTHAWLAHLLIYTHTHIYLTSVNVKLCDSLTLNVSIYSSVYFLVIANECGGLHEGAYEWYFVWKFGKWACDGCFGWNKCGKL